MIIYTLPDGRQLRQGHAFELNGEKFSRTWLGKATPEMLDARGIIVEDVPPQEPEPPTISDLLAYLADKRWQVETGGFLFNGLAIATDLNSQVKVAGAKVNALADPNFEITNWKTGPGIFVPLLDNATIIAIGNAVTVHVQTCFDKEQELTAAILADPPTITTYAEIDAADWPA